MSQDRRPEVHALADAVSGFRPEGKGTGCDHPSGGCHPEIGQCSQLGAVLPEPWWLSQERLDPEQEGHMGTGGRKQFPGTCSEA